MRIYVSVDIEGISGVVHADMMMPGQPEYGRGRMLMTKDANAAIEGLVQAGADDILVADGHGPMRNILIEDLHEAASLMTGTGDAREACQLEGADGGTFDAAVFVGYHAMARTMHAIHPHTIAGAVVCEIRINGRPHGETGINAAVLGSMGIPTIMVTGDQALVKEARDFLGDSIETVQVKEARGHNAAICRPLKSCHAEITEAAQRAAGKIGDIQPYTVEGPWTLEVDFNTMAQCNRAARTANIERVSALGCVVHGESPWEQYQALWAALRSALYEPAAWLK